MNREETRKAAEVMMHYANGGEVQWRGCPTQSWQDVTATGTQWNWTAWDYRIKPQPVEITCYAVICNGVHDSTYRNHYDADHCAKSMCRAGKEAFIVPLKGTYTCDT